MARTWEAISIMPLRQLGGVAGRHAWARRVWPTTASSHWRSVASRKSWCGLHCLWPTKPAREVAQTLRSWRLLRWSALPIRCGPVPVQRPPRWNSSTARARGVRARAHCAALLQCVLWVGERARRGCWAAAGARRRGRAGAALWPRSCVGADAAAASIMSMRSCTSVARAYARAFSSPASRSREALCFSAAQARSGPGAGHAALLWLRRMAASSRGPLWLEPVPAEPGDVVQRDDAPEMAEGGAGGAIFREDVEQLGQRLLAERAGYIWHTQYVRSDRNDWPD